MFTGSVYKGFLCFFYGRLDITNIYVYIKTDLSLLKSGYHGEGRTYDGTTLVQKTHHTAVMTVDDENQAWRENHIRTFGGRGVLLIRNPYRAILSAWNYYNSMNHTGHMDPLTFQSSAFRKFVFRCINRYRQPTDTYKWITLSLSVKLGGIDKRLVNQV